MSWWQFWKRGKEEKKSGMTYVLGGGNPPRTPALGKPTVTNLVSPPGGSSTLGGMGMNPMAGQGIGAGAASTTFSESVGSENQSAEDWFDKSNDQFRSGNLLGAIASFDRAIEVKPDYHEAWYNRGVALGDLGRNEEAIASCDKALEIKPDYYEAWYNRGAGLGNLGRYEEAIDSFNKALEIKSDHHHIWYGQGRVLEKSGRDEEAIASYDRAIEIKPDLHEAWNNRGLALVNLGRYEDAITSYDRAIEIKPNLHEAWLNRGVALDKLGRYEEAIASYDRAIEIKPDDDAAWYNRGLALVDLDRDEDAIASYDRAIEIKPDKDEAWINRGVAVSNLRRNYRAALGRPLSYSLQNPAIDQWGYSGEIANYRQGLEFCKQDTHPEGWGYLHWYMGRAHYRQGKKSDRSLFAAAREEYELALETLTEAAFPETRLEVFQDYVKLFWQLNQPKKVRTLLQQASELLQALIAKSPQSKERLERKFISFQQVTVDLCLQSGDIAQALVLAEQSKATCLSWMITTAPMDWQQIQNLVWADGGAFIYWYYSPLALHTILLLPNEVPLLIATTSVDGAFPQEEDPHPSPLPEREREQEGLLLPFSPRGRRGRGMRGLSDFLTTWNEQYSNYTGKDKTKETRDETWRQKLPNHLTHLTEILSIEKILPILREHNIENLTLIPHRDLHRLPLHALGFPPQIKIRYLPTLHLRRGSPLPPYPYGKAKPIKRGGIDREVPLQRGEIDVEAPVQRGEMSLNLEISLLKAEESKTPLLKGGRGDLRLLSIEAPNSTDLEAGKPLSSLSYALIESEYICQTIGDPLHRIADAAATKDQVIHALNQGCEIFHFTGHAGYNFNSPKKSALCLSKDDRLTIEELIEIPLDRCQLVCLSACETGITGKQTILDEYVGLVSAFLSQGVGTVVSTLWPVESAASAIIMMEFYRRRKNLDDITALHKTTHWLRAATAQDLIMWWENIKAEREQLPEIEEIIDSELRMLSKKSRIEGTPPPYSDPYYWAAFTITGG